MNRHQRRAQYAVPSRSYPYLQINPRRAQEVNRGMNLISRFIVRGIAMNSQRAPQKGGKLFSMKSMVLGIKRGIVGV